MDYIYIPHVWNQTGALAEVSVNYTGLSIYCSSGSIGALINGQPFTIDAGETLDEAINGGKTFEVIGTGVWKGFLRGAK